MNTVDRDHDGTSSRRRWLARIASAAWAMSPRHPAFAAATVTQWHAVSGFDELRWRATGGLRIEQTTREQLSVEAEPAVLSKLVIEVRQRRLWIGFAPGRVETRQPIRFRLAVKSLAALDTHGSGDIRIGPLTGAGLSLVLAGSDDLQLARLSARTLDARLTGSGSATITSGEVEAQRIELAGSGDYVAPRLASRRAEITSLGSGDAGAAANERLTARLSGRGSVDYRGDAEVSTAVSGSGSVRHLAR